MQALTVLLVVLAALVALAIVLFQYYYKQKSKGKLRFVLSFLRFVTLFAIFLLLLNPKFIKKDFSVIKANLMILVDNSSSIPNNGPQVVVDSVLDILNNSTELSDKYNIAQYKFGNTISALDSLDFKDSSTDITNALKGVNTVLGNKESAVVLLSDGNSTLGEDYEYYGMRYGIPVYPIVLGDTTHYDDLKITQVNTNKYAFLNNRFPIEIFVSYDGDAPMATRLNISMNGQNVHTQKLNLSRQNNSIALTVNPKATTVGLKNIKIDLEPLPNEKNINNNVKNVSVEVIDEKTNITIVTDLTHPDIGVLKKSIESNEQRSVTIVKPTTDLNELDESDLVITYQPTFAFKGIFELIRKDNLGSFIISGPKTDWNFLNEVQGAYTKNSFGQTEEVTPLLNKGFSKFDISAYNFENFPPLETNLGEVIVNTDHEVLIYQKIKGIDIGEPLLVLSENNMERKAILFGENLWKWRMQNFREHQDFNDFDELINKIILYLTINERKSRLVLNYDPLYESSIDVKITADYFDESFSFDPNAEISLTIQKKGEGYVQELPMLLKGSYYEADLSSMPPGEYDFNVEVANEDISKSGQFNIMDFNLEQQFTSSNYRKLDRLAESSGGRMYFPAQTSNLIDDLMGENKFIPIQKSNENVVSLIDFKILLAIIIAALTMEWFYRKYNGLT